MIPENIVEITRKMLRERPANVALHKIADDLDLGRSWLSEFMRRTDVDPGTTKIVKLYNYLVALKNEQ